MILQKKARRKNRKRRHLKKEAKGPESQPAFWLIARGLFKKFWKRGVSENLQPATFATKWGQKEFLRKSQAEEPGTKF